MNNSFVYSENVLNTDILRRKVLGPGDTIKKTDKILGFLELTFSQG